MASSHMHREQKFTALISFSMRSPVLMEVGSRIFWMRFAFYLESQTCHMYESLLLYDVDEIPLQDYC